MSASAVVLNGRPFVKEITIETTENPQVFDFEQDADGDVFVATDHGLAQYNGESWENWKTSGDSFIRTLLVENGFIFTGGDNEFGFFKKNPNLEWRYQSLTGQLSKELKRTGFGDIWRIKHHKGKIYFGALYDLFIYDLKTKQVQEIHYEGKFGAFFDYGDQLLLQFRGKGFVSLDKKSDKPLFKDPEGLLVDLVLTVEKVVDRYIILKSDNTWVEVVDDKVVSLKMPDSLSLKGAVNDFIVLGQDELVMSSLRGNLINWKLDSQEFKYFNVSNEGLWRLKKARHNGLLAISATSLFYMKQPANWSVVAKDSGLSGNINKFAVWNNDWFVLTDAGLYKSVPGWVGGKGWPAFKPVKNLISAQWDFLALSEETAVIANAYFLKLIDKNLHVTHVSEEKLYPRLLKRSKYCNDIIYVGTENGLAVFQWNGVQLQLAHFYKHQHQRVESIVELSCGNLLYKLEGVGIYHAQSVETVNLSSSEYQDELLSINTESQSELALQEIDGQIIVLNNSNVWAFNNYSFVKHSGYDIDLLNLDVTPHLVRTKDGKLWAYTNNELFLLLDSGEWQKQNLKGLKDGWIVGTTTKDETTYWINRQSVLKYSEVSTDEQISDQPAVKLTSVRFEDKNGLQKLDVKGNIKKFKPGDNSFQFSYALLDLEATDHARYQSRLYPFDKNWSKQDSTTEWTFTKLKPDHYTFQVRAIDSNGHLSESEPFEFIIEQYWYLSRLAIVLQIILAIIIFASLVYLIVKWRLKSVIDEKRRLAVMVEERTAELQQANARLKQLANVDQLTGVANRRMLDRYLDRVWKTCIEKEQPLSLLMFDLDHFKKYNDTKGHQAGDNALIAVGKILLKLFDQNNELPSRFGGEEFVVVLPECDLDQAIKKAEQTRLFIEQSDVGITASIGVLSAVPKKEIKIQKWFKKVDEALYLAKEEGRNRVVIGELNDF